MTEILPGLSAELEHVVTADDTASRWGSGLGAPGPPSTAERSAA